MKKIIALAAVAAFTMTTTAIASNCATDSTDSQGFKQTSCSQKDRSNDRTGGRDGKTDSFGK